MPRKKKTETIETENMNSVESKSNNENLEVAVKESTEVKSETSEETKEKKKRSIKKLSETELKRVMTDTKETLVPLTDYISCSIHLGTKVITPDMRKFVYKRRADGLAVMNTNLIDDKIRDGVKFLNEFSPEEVFIVGKREACWPAIDKFSEVTGIRKFTKKYPAGIITNLNLDNFFEVKTVLICDPWVDKNAYNDAIKLQLPILAICDTNNYTKHVNPIIIGNNKSRKSVGLILFILAREYLKAQGKEDEAKALKIEDFTGKLEQENSEKIKEEKESVAYGV